MHHVLTDSATWNPGINKFLTNIYCLLDDIKMIKFHQYGVIHD
jgi:hypothetical protein